MKASARRYFIVAIVMFVLLVGTYYYLYEKSDKSVQNYCPPESRMVEVCLDRQQHVCGFFDPARVQCVTSPCASTYTNNCYACQEKDVLYWVKGKCISS